MRTNIDTLCTLFFVVLFNRENRDRENRENRVLSKLGMTLVHRCALPTRADALHETRRARGKAQRGLSTD